MVKIINLLFYMFSATILFSQTTIKGVVKDAENKEPLAFCSISIINKTNGTITNADGNFEIKTNEDSLYASIFYLGYSNIKLWLKKNTENIIYIKKENFVINEVTINSYTNNKIASIILLLKNKIKNNINEEIEAKLITRTFTLKNDTVPIEINEAIYSADVNTSSVKNLQIKSGKIGFGKTNNTTFYSLNIAKEYLQQIELFKNNGNQTVLTSSEILNSYYNKNDNIPNLETPFLCNTKEDVIKYFDLSYNEIDSTYSKIEYKQKNNLTSGTIIFNQKNSEIIKITIYKTGDENIITSINPTNQITDVNTKIHITFTNFKNVQIIDFVSLDFKIVLKTKNNNYDTISTNFIANLFDFGKPYSVPEYGIERDFNDYEGIIITGNKESLIKNDFILKTETENKIYTSIFENSLQKKIIPTKYISIEEINDSSQIQWQLLNSETKNKFAINSFVYCDYYKTINNTYIFDTKAFVDYFASYFTYKENEDAEKFINGILQISKKHSDILKKTFAEKYGKNYVPYYKIKKELANTYKNIEYEKQKYIKANKEKLTKCPTTSFQAQ